MVIVPTLADASARASDSDLSSRRSAAPAGKTKPPPGPQGRGPFTAEDKCAPRPTAALLHLVAPPDRRSALPLTAPYFPVAPHSIATNDCDLLRPFPVYRASLRLVPSFCASSDFLASHCVIFLPIAPRSIAAVATFPGILRLIALCCAFLRRFELPDGRIYRALLRLIAPIAPYCTYCA